MRCLCYLVLLAVASSVARKQDYAHTQPSIVIADIPSYSTQHKSALTCPTLDCHETMYRNINEACSVEYDLWEKVEKHCPALNVSSDAWDGSSYSYFLNPRRYYNMDNMQQLVSFGISSKNASFAGATWRVIVRGMSLLHNEIQATGRIIDHWNGNYTAYIALPMHGKYTMDIILEYAACGGYPTSLRYPHNAALDYIGHVERIPILWNLSHAHHTLNNAPVSAVSIVSVDVLRYLADTGYYVGTIWHPPQHTLSCVPPALLPTGNISFVLAGDSTFRQIYNCLIGYTTCVAEDCAASKRQHDYCEQLYHDAPAPLTEQNMEFWRQRRDNTTTKFVRVDHQAERIEAILEAATVSNSSIPLVLVIGFGLHPMVNMNWEEQKSTFLAIQQTIDKFPNVFRRNGEYSTSGQTVYVIWKDVWAVHEYCYVPNTYWNRFQWSLRNTWFGWSFSSRVLQARDASAQLQNSFFMDQVLRKSNTIMYLSTYWSSKAFGKSKREHDMRHHNEVVVATNVKQLLDLLGGSTQENR